MYGSAPGVDYGYINEETAAYLCERVSRFGCRAMHIGGGEPFTDLNGLVALIKTMRKHRIDIDYIETNAAWVTGDEQRDMETLNAVVQAGGDCVMVSADLFHIEFIPFRKVQTLIHLLEKARIPYFVWQARYLSTLSKLDPDALYDEKRLDEELGRGARLDAAAEYGMGFNGRALNLARRLKTKKSAGDFLSGKPCDNLSGTNHFHADLYGRYIPPGCTGMGIDLSDLGEPLSASAYPAMSRLYGGGLRALYDYATGEGFEPVDTGYASKCDLCFAMRKYLYINDEKNHPDLTPGWFYRQGY